MRLLREYGVGNRTPSHNSVVGLLRRRIMEIEADALHLKMVHLLTNLTHIDYFCFKSLDPKCAPTEWVVVGNKKWAMDAPPRYGWGKKYGTGINPAVNH